jgi:predicted  nucleic acid-binding Zn-ribbon protein
LFGIHEARKAKNNLVFGGRGETSMLQVEDLSAQPDEFTKAVDVVHKLVCDVETLTLALEHEKKRGKDNRTKSHEAQEKVRAQLEQTQQDCDQLRHRQEQKAKEFTVLVQRNSSLKAHVTSFKSAMDRMHCLVCDPDTLFGIHEARKAKNNLVFGGRGETSMLQVEDQSAQPDEFTKAVDVVHKLVCDVETLTLALEHEKKRGQDERSSHLAFSIGADKEKSRLLSLNISLMQVQESSAERISELETGSSVAASSPSGALTTLQSALEGARAEHERSQTELQAARQTLAGCQGRIAEAELFKILAQERIAAVKLAAGEHEVEAESLRAQMAAVQQQLTSARADLCHSWKACMHLAGRCNRLEGVLKLDAATLRQPSTTESEVEKYCNALYQQYLSCWQTPN